MIHKKIILLTVVCTAFLPDPVMANLRDSANNKWERLPQEKDVYHKKADLSKAFLIIDNILDMHAFSALTWSEINALAKARGLSPQATAKVLDAYSTKMGDALKATFFSRRRIGTFKSIIENIEILSRRSASIPDKERVTRMISDLLEIKINCTKREMSASEKKDCSNSEMNGNKALRENKDFARSVYNNTPPYAPQEQHVKAILSILNSSKPVTLFEGVPGSGKTASALTWVVQTFKNLDKKVFVTAPNPGGQAAIRGDFKDYPEVCLAYSDLINGHIPQNSVVIVDEVYLTPLLDFRKILQIAVAKNIKLIFSGDSQQNLPVGPSIIGLLDNLPIVHLFDSNRATLQEHKDFAGTSVLHSISHAVKAFENNIICIRDNVISSKLIDAAFDQMDELMEHDSNLTIDDSFIFVADNEYVSAINDQFHEKLMDQGKISNPMQTEVVKTVTNPITRKRKEHKSTIQIGVGSKILLTETHKTLDPRTGESIAIAKGTPGIVRDRTATKLIIDFATNKGVEIDLRRFNALDFAYAINSADSQGMSVPYVFIVPSQSTNRAELYVALTRHKKNVFIYLLADQFPTIESFQSYDWFDLNAEVRTRTIKAMVYTNPKPRGKANSLNDFN